MSAQINPNLGLKQIEQIWLIAPEAALAEEWENNGCCAKSLQPLQPVERPSSASAYLQEWQLEQCT